MLLKVFIGCFLLFSCAVKKPDSFVHQETNAVQKEDIHWKIYEDTDEDGVNDLLEYALVGYDPEKEDVDENSVETINLMAEKIKESTLKTNRLQYSSGNPGVGELNFDFDEDGNPITYKLGSEEVVKYELGSVESKSEVHILLNPALLFRPIQKMETHIKRYPLEETPPLKPNVKCYFNSDYPRRHRSDGNGRRIIPCNVSMPTTPPDPVEKSPCVVKAHARPDLVAMDFKISEENDIFSGLKLKIGKSLFSLEDLEDLNKAGKIKFHWFADYKQYVSSKRFNEKLLISIRDLSLITEVNETTLVEFILPLKSPLFYQGITIEKPYHPDTECLEFAKSIGKKYGLNLWKESWGKDPSREVKFYTLGSGFEKYEKDYSIIVHSIISTKKEDL